MSKIFREFTTKSEKLILAGKNVDSNEALVKQAGQNEFVLHTKERGSPFVNIKAPKNEIVKEDIKEASIICAKYSHDWRDNKKDIIVHIFLGNDIYKEKGMKTGTFGVKKLKEIKVRKEDIEKFEKEKS
jgi:predicted ribosome quality control (RQC) complex YloA/Tae2 family protein